MPNVRIDENGVPKAAVFEHTAPIAHRSGVTGVDVGDPDIEDAVDASGFEHIDFDLDITLGGTDPLLEVTPLFYGASAAAWFRGESQYFTASGRVRVRTDARGARVFLAVTALEGDTPTLDLDAWASLS
ncbi:MAG: hypothetical protein AB7F65_05570 [Dehalococcoidia bacterium]